MKRSKKYREVAKTIDRATLYDVNEGIALAKGAAKAKFDETIEVHIRTGCDGRHADQQMKPLQQALTLLEQKNWFRRSRRKAGLTLML